MGMSLWRVGGGGGDEREKRRKIKSLDMKNGRLIGI